jgi:hypothetical protein
VKGARILRVRLLDLFQQLLVSLPGAVSHTSHFALTVLSNIAYRTVKP